MPADAVHLVIPARFASTRFPGKPLATLRGADGVAHPLIRWTHAAARRVPGVSRVLVATDDARIAAAVAAFGGEAIMTDPACRNGTERCADAAARLGLDHGMVVNLQGDAPLTPPAALAALIRALREDPAIEVATPVIRCGDALADRLRAAERAGEVGGTTAVVGATGDALYFSKRVLPFGAGAGDLLFHIGAYAYRVEALRRYAAHPPCRAEELEGLEQLRFLHLGAPVRTVEIAAPPGGVWEVNNPGDVAIVEAGLAARADEV